MSYFLPQDTKTNLIEFWKSMPKVGLEPTHPVKGG